MEEHKEVLEFEQRCCSESLLIPKPSDRLQYFANSIDELKLAEGLMTRVDIELLLCIFH